MADSNGPRLRASREMRLLSGPPLDQSPTGRRCTAAGCTSLLSRYNPSAVCGAHAGWQDAAPTRRRSSE